MTININDIEEGLGKYGVKPQQLIAGMFQLQIENNALLHVILQKQAEYVNLNYPEITIEDYITPCNEESSSRYKEILTRMLQQM